MIALAPASRRREQPIELARRWLTSFNSPLQLAVFGLMPLIGLVFLIRLTLLTPGGVATDFHHVYWAASHRLLLGENPYLWTAAQIQGGSGFVYPAPTAFAFVPLALLHVDPAGLVMTAVCIALFPATLWILGVRDPRLYGCTVMWLPVYEGWQTANLTLPLVFGCAVIWRLRERPGRAGVLAGLAPSLKPVIWPIVLWLCCTRRWRAAAWAVASGAAVNVIAWLVLGPSYVHDYLHLLSAVTAAHWRGGYGMPAVLAHLGLSHRAGSVIEFATAAALVLAIAREGLGQHNERRALVLATALVLVASPLVWTHYFAVLLLPMAIIQPRLSAIWLLPILMWVCPTSEVVALWRSALAWAISLTCLCSLYGAAA